MLIDIQPYRLYGYMYESENDIEDRRKRHVSSQERSRPTGLHDVRAGGLRALFQTEKSQSRISALPKFRSGGSFVDIADREALFQTMEDR
jgi:hypothetical protein